jgi:hypothetical protein
VRTARLFLFLLTKEGAMPVLNLTSPEPTRPGRTPRPGLQESAECCLRRNPYLALRGVACDCRDGVLVLRGCLPSYYLKQVAQEAVVSLEGVEAVDNRIEVVTPASRSMSG